MQYTIKTGDTAYSIIASQTQVPAADRNAYAASITDQLGVYADDGVSPYNPTYHLDLFAGTVVEIPDAWVYRQVTSTNGTTTTTGPSSGGLFGLTPLQLMIAGVMVLAILEK